MGAKVRTSFSNEWPYPPLSDSEEDRVIAKKIRYCAIFAASESDQIDEAIEKEKRARESRRGPRKVLLLGPSQSGKSTLLKHFKLLFAPQAFANESEAWRAVIHLNLVRTVNYILDTLSPPGTTSPPYGPRRQNSGPDFREIRIRLSPLRQVEISLKSCLSADQIPRRPSSVYDDLRIDEVMNISIRGGNVWKALAKAQDKNPWVKTELQKTRSILNACRDDILTLWSDPAVKAALQDHDVVVEDWASFDCVWLNYILRSLLDNATRICSKDYSPMPEDILRTRLETVGVEEHHVTMETVDQGQEWIFYDIEGSRGQRASWVPYFDDVHTIIFLVSMADFDQSSETPGLDRLTDSFNLWRTICENKLLERTPLILFLNKSDLLQAKLELGTSFGQYVRNFSQPNTVQAVAKYYRNLFTAAHDMYSPCDRMLYVHTTCAIDTESMSSVLREVKETILVGMLRDISVL
ncbi:P-loop containing nucleoside triphosphate hydrolase protein [Panus rudis PR-1116 ss-1]|nr:P-loop containing nucleoside triphosphate hydrolase protein [Panus rudis PR-1116 ss-1]